MPRTLIIIPTYNEAENILRIVPEILSVAPDIDVLVVDDNSPDGTSEAVRKMGASDHRVHLLLREKKMGLGTAYVAGFKYALAHDYDYVFEMDADFSHDPKEIPKMLSAMERCDLVIGSRYINGVRVLDWPMKRLLLSYFANVYTRIITGMPVRDATGGFKCYRRKVLESIDLDRIRSNGYAFQIETNFKAWAGGFRVCEHPIVFVDRRLGTSKMNKGIIYEAAFMVWKLKFQHLFRKL